MCAWKWGIVTTIAFVVISFWAWIVNRPVQSIGNAYLVPAEGPPGTKVDICIDNLVWYRICPAKTFSQIITGPDEKGIISVYDRPVHTISKPSNPVKIAHKCREWGEIPNIGRGLARVVSRVESYCPIIGSMGKVTIVTAIPEMQLMVK